MANLLVNLAWIALIGTGGLLTVWAYVVVTTKPARHDDDHEPYGDASTYGRRMDQ
jgi:hypothetical protein